MSNCPNCGASEVGGMNVMWQCGTKNPAVPTLTCQNHKLHNDLAAANAVIDAIKRHVDFVKLPPETRQRLMQVDAIDTVRAVLNTVQEIVGHTLTKGGSDE